MLFLFINNIFAYDLKDIKIYDNIKSFSFFLSNIKYIEINNENSNIYIKFKKNTNFDYNREIIFKINEFCKIYVNQNILKNFKLDKNIINNSEKTIFGKEVNLTIFIKLLENRLLNKNSLITLKNITYITNDPENRLLKGFYNRFVIPKK